MKDQIYTPDEIKHQINKTSIPVYGNLCIHTTYNVQGSVDIEMEKEPTEKLEKFIRKIVANVNDIYTTSS